MDEAQVLALIDKALGASLKSAFGEFRNYTAEQMKPLLAKLEEFEVAGSTPSAADEPVAPGASSPEMSALMSRLATMEKQEQDRQAEVKAYKFSNDLGSQVSKFSPIHGDMVKELLSSRYGSKAVEKDGEWYLPSGTKLSEEVDSFFKSETGQHFISNPAVGGGTQSSTSVQNAPKGKVTSDDMFADMVI
jgi:hypothetical protein